MGHDLFRREALEAKRGSWLGSVQLSQSLPPKLLSGAAVLVAVVVVLFLTLGTYTRRSRVVGQLVPVQGLATVLAPATGVVSRLETVEGARTAARAPLVVVAIPRATPLRGDTSVALARQLESRQKSLEAARRAQSGMVTAQVRGLTTQLDVARAELAGIESEIDTQRAQVRIARETLERVRRLESDHFVSELERRQSEAQTLQSVSTLQALQGKALAARRSIAQLQQAIRELPQQRLAAEANFSQERAQLEQEQLQADTQSAVVVNAPVDGVVSTQLVKAGQSVQAGQPLLSIIPGDGRLQAELLVPSRAVGFIQSGDRVLLRYQAFPYQKFGHQEGHVTRVGRSALTPAELSALIGTQQASEPMYRVTVSLARQTIVAYGRAESLRPGMLLEADILGESRSLVEWMLEPLYAVKGKVF